MQTFLSEPTFHESARVLDSVRLNKQYLEGWQILNAIALTPEGGSQRINGKCVFAANHPATNQWRGHEDRLYCYLNAIRAELDLRGIKTDKIAEKIHLTMDEGNFRSISSTAPVWYDSVIFDKIMWTHRASLYKKNPEHYAHYYVDSLTLDRCWERVVCCTTHARYYYPSHDKENIK